MSMRVIFLPAASIAASVVLYLALASIGKADEPPAPPLVVEVPETVQGKTAAEWNQIAARYRRHALRRWQPTVDYALRLASRVFHVSYWQMRTVSYCESRWYPYARNGRYLGIFQMHWRPFGFSQYDPVASALSAAQTVVRDGGWSQWECKP